MKKNLGVAWIDFRKAYDMVPQSWILKTLELAGTARNIIELLKVCKVGKRCCSLGRKN